MKLSTFVLRVTGLAEYSKLEHLTFYAQLSAEDQGAMDLAHGTFDPAKIEKCIRDLKSKNIEYCTLTELRELAKEKHIPYYTKLSRQTLIERVKGNPHASPAP